MNTDKILKALLDSNHDYITVGKVYKMHPDAVKRLEKKANKSKPVVVAKKILEPAKKIAKAIPAQNDSIPIQNDIDLSMDDKEFIDAIREARTNGINKLAILIKSETDPVRLVTAINKIDEVLKRHTDKETKEEDKDEYFKLT